MPLLKATRLGSLGPELRKYPCMVENTLVLTRRDAVFFVAVAITAPAIALADPDAHLKIRLLAVSDLHCYLEAYDYYHDAPEDTVGLVRIASLVKAAKAESPNALLFDNGDLLQGNPLGDLAALGGPLPKGAVHPVIKAMNAMGYDAATPGNHDFNYGLEFLDSAIAGAKFPYVLANIDKLGGASWLPPYMIIERTFTRQRRQGASGKDRRAGPGHPADHDVGQGPSRRPRDRGGHRRTGPQICSGDSRQGR